MTSLEDYWSLIQGFSHVDLSTTTAEPCELLLTGDSALPVVVSTKQQVLIAASKYGKGRMMVLSHEDFMHHAQLMKFLSNAVSWLKPTPQATIGVHRDLHLLADSLSIVEVVEITSGLKEDLGVLCMPGYEDSQAEEIISFLKQGGGLLIGAQALSWSSSHKDDNVFYDFPGNKITSVGGIYFTNNYGDAGNFSVSRDIPYIPMHIKAVNFSKDLKSLLNGITSLDINGDAVPSELLLHGPLTFPVALSDDNKCFFAAAYYGRGRVFVGGHEAFFTKPELKPLVCNAIRWLKAGRKGPVGLKASRQDAFGLTINLADLAPILEHEGISCEVSNISPGQSVYCCPSYSTDEALKIQKFVAEGGGLFVAGQSWYWSSSNPNPLSRYPGNQIINKFGISIVNSYATNGVFKALDPSATESTYNFPRAVTQLIAEKKGEGGSLLSKWMPKIKEDVGFFMKLPPTPITASQQQEMAALKITDGE